MYEIAAFSQNKIYSKVFNISNLLIYVVLIYVYIYILNSQMCQIYGSSK